MLSLKVSDLQKSFISPAGKSLPVLQNASCEFQPGETIAVQGASGAGKSTLLHLIGGLEAADAGSIVFDGFEITAAGGKALSRYRATDLGVVFQFHHLLADFTALENVAMPLLINRRPRQKSFEVARQLLIDFDLSEQADQPVRSLSGGEQQRIALARVIVSNPRLVLADEPTGSLDASISDQIETILFRYAAETRAVVVFATHSARLASKCDRQFLLSDGKLEELSV